MNEGDEIRPVEDLEETSKESYKRGLKDGIERFAWWKDGTCFVGTCGTTLKKAFEEVDRELR